ncbi:hypothetical protein UlMin_017797 [Ulmus minor]
MKNKRIQFGYIRDRVIRKLQGWKKRTFSQGGKEVLLKSVVQFIPTYTMSYFILPDSLVKDIEAACAHFLWGSSSDHKKVHWKKWADLCRSKSEGVFKAKYFHSSAIWHATANSNASYVWKSILWGRNLVVRGVRWRVGDGRSISVYNSRWIPTPHSFLVSSLGLFLLTTVHSLFLCSTIKFLWKKSRMLDYISAAKAGNMVDVAFWAKNQLSSDQFELFAMYTWEIWNLRNLWTHGKEAVIMSKELSWIPGYISSFKACTVTTHNLPRSPQPSRWTAPVFGQLRLDVDAAFDANSKSYGLGAVIRDSAGSLIVAGVWPGQYASSVGQAELMAVQAGLRMAKEYGLSSLIVYCDVVNEVAKLKMNYLLANEDGIVINDIKQLASTLNVVSFNYFSRTCNGVAHCLARNSFHRLSYEYWVGDAQPSWLVSTLLADIWKLIFSVKKKKRIIGPILLKKMYKI